MNNASLIFFKTISKNTKLRIYYSTFRIFVELFVHPIITKTYAYIFLDFLILFL